ncbi:MAG: HAD family phosphatase [Deltaproteobacteria bacterium]|nr:HAD family phosphatase [Deltaproteobacteria bacterium]
MLRAVIFDCDGVIADSERSHLRAFQRVLSEEGLTLSEEDYFARYLAMDDRGCFTAVYRDAGRQLDGGLLRDLISRKAACYLDEVKGGVELVPGAVDLARGLARLFPCAIASGALRHEVEMVLEAAMLTASFTTIVTAEDVSRGKPDPESFVTALARINAATGASPPVLPADCLVIEDSRHGIAAAHAAGMPCLAVATSYPAEELAEAEMVVKGFVGFDAETVVARFGGQ